MTKNNDVKRNCSWLYAKERARWIIKNDVEYARLIAEERKENYNKIKNTAAFEDMVADYISIVDYE